jgi:hypothetical protein
MPTQSKMKFDPTRILIGSIGAGLLLLACVLCFQEQKFINTASVADGIAMDSGFGPAHPIIQFKTGGGQSISYPQGGAVAIKAGEHVTVLYDPEYPLKTACVRRFGALFFAPTGLALFAICFLMVPVFPTIFTIP